VSASTALENFIAIHENYPGGTPQSERERVVGSEDKWVLTPSFTPLRIVGTGDTYTVVAMVTYPGGQQSHLVSIVDLKTARSPALRPSSRTPSMRRPGEHSGSSG
jgi:hypothetical protein